MNEAGVHALNVTLGAGAIVLQVISVIALGILFFGPRKSEFLDFVNKHFLPIGLLLSLSAVSFALVYSEIIHFVPCVLCWWQRVFMFPLTLMFGVALWDKDRKVMRYALPLLLAGLAVSLYQNFFYYFGESSAPCDASGVSCYARLVSEFGGYVSIPMFSLTIFFALLTLVCIAHFYPKRHNA